MASDAPAATPVAAAPAASVATPAGPSTKVFVGNLSFKTREPDLAKIFEEVGPVKTANIIARGPRSLGYGFVEFEKAEDAERSVAALNKREIDGRPVNVEVARPQPAPGTYPPRPRRAPRAPRAPRAAAPAGAAAASPAAAAPAAAPAAGAAAPAGARPPRKPRAPRAPRPAGAAPAAGAVAAAAPAAAPAAGAAAPAGARPPRKPRTVRAPRAANPEGPSKTTLFVANLPFIVDDAGLLEIFEGLNVKEAHVVLRPNGRSKGYGFVTFENEADCNRALQTVDKSVVEDRTINVHPALAPFRKTVAAPAAAAAPATAAQ